MPKLFKVLFSPNGTQLASIACTPYTQGIPPEIHIWDVASAKERYRLTGHQSWVRTAAFSPDSHFLVTGDGDGLVKV